MGSVFITILCLVVEFIATLAIGAGSAGFFTWLFLIASNVGALFFSSFFLFDKHIEKKSLTPKIFGVIGAISWIVGIAMMANGEKLPDSMVKPLLVILLVSPYLIFACLIALNDDLFFIAGIAKLVSSIFYYKALPQQLVSSIFHYNALPNITNISTVHIIIMALMILMMFIMMVITRKENRGDAFLNSIVNGSCENAKQWLENGGDANARDSYDATLLMLACRSGNLDMVKLLVNKGATIDSDTVEYAFQNNLKITKFLLENGADIAYKYTWDLIAAVKNNNRMESFSLLEKGAKLYCKDSKGNSALYYAAIVQKNVDFSRKLLVKDGTFVNKYNDVDILKPFMSALKGYGYKEDKNIDEIIFFTLFMPTLDCFYKYGKEYFQFTTPLRWAISNGCGIIVPLMIACGADVNYTGGDINNTLFTYTPLGEAILSGAEDTVSFLLEHGADVNKVANSMDSGDGSALDFAYKKGRHLLIPLLEKYGAK